MNVALKQTGFPKFLGNPKLSALAIPLLVNSGNAIDFLGRFYHEAPPFLVGFLAAARPPAT